MTKRDEERYYEELRLAVSPVTAWLSALAFLSLLGLIGFLAVRGMLL